MTKTADATQQQEQPRGIVCTTCLQRVYMGDGHAEGCAAKARSIAYNNDLRERLRKADALAQKERERRARDAAKRTVVIDENGEPVMTATMTSTRTTRPDDVICSASGAKTRANIVVKPSGRRSECHSCGQSVRLKADDTFTRHAFGAKGKAKASTAKPAPAKSTTASKSTTKPKTTAAKKRESVSKSVERINSKRTTTKPAAVKSTTTKRSSSSK